MTYYACAANSANITEKEQLEYFSSLKMGDIFVLSNLIKWTVVTPEIYATKLESKSFEIRNHKCKFIYYSGNNSFWNRARPMEQSNFSIDFDIKRKFNPTVLITVLVSSKSETFAPQRCDITGENKQIIWSRSSSCFLLNTRITLEMIIHDLKVDKCIQTVSYLNSNVSPGSLSGDFFKLLDSNLNHDAEIKCGAHSQKAHKNVLSARSEVFKAMLQSDLQEARTGVIEMKDMDVNYFQDFMEYLYTGVMRELTFDKAKALYEAGAKYAVSSLVHECSEYFQDNLSRDNALESFTLADVHSDQKLKDRIVTYILEEKNYVQAEFWEPFCESFPKVATDVYKLVL